jgi:hypothetical protein
VAHRSMFSGLGAGSEIACSWVQGGRAGDVVGAGSRRARERQLACEWPTMYVGRMSAKLMSVPGRCRETFGRRHESEIAL